MLTLELSKTRTSNAICKEVKSLFDDENLSMNRVGEVFNRKPNIDYSLYADEKVAIMLVNYLQIAYQGRVIKNSKSGEVGIVHSVGFSNRELGSMHVSVVIIKGNEIYNTTWSLSAIEPLGIDAYAYIKSIQQFMKSL